MEKLFLDTNIVLDLIENREPFVKDAVLFLQLLVAEVLLSSMRLNYRLMILKMRCSSMLHVRLRPIISSPGIKKIFLFLR